MLAVLRSGQLQWHTFKKLNIDKKRGVEVCGIFVGGGLLRPQSISCPGEVPGCQCSSVQMDPCVAVIGQ